MKAFISKIMVATALGIIWFLIAYFNLIIKYVPGFYCEGWGCFGAGIVYFIHLPIILFLVNGFLAFLVNKKNRFKHIFISSIVLIGVLLVVFSIYSTAIEQQKEKLVEKTKMDEQAFLQEIKNKQEKIYIENRQLGAIGYIQKKYPNDTKKQKILFNLVDQLENIAIASDIKKINRYEFSRAVNCAINNNTNELAILKLFVFNTKGKEDKYKQFIEIGVRNSVGWDFLDNVNCDFEK